MDNVYSVSKRRVIRALIASDWAKCGGKMGIIGATGSSRVSLASLVSTCHLHA